MESVAPPSRMIGTVFALAAFAVALLSGLVAGKPASEVVLFALVVLVVGRVVGGVLGSMAVAAVDSAVESHVDARPIPDVEEALKKHSDGEVAEAA